MAEYIAKTLMGLEPFLAEELTGLGADEIEIGRRMVKFSGDKELLYRANFSLRTALRVLKPIKTFTAKNPDEVYNAIKAYDWSELLNPKMSFAVDTVVYSEEFTHSKFVAYRVKDAIVDQFMERYNERPNIILTNPDIRIHLHIAETTCTLALDSSGESLHVRGYRQSAVMAPINEVLAAGIIMQTGWRGESDFIDPMCGSGTFLIEAALIAQNIAPGVFRQHYAFEKWPDYDADLFESIYNDDSMERPFNHKIYGYDIDPKAVGIARANVKAAGLSNIIDVNIQNFADFQKPQEKSIIVMNPPYGERLSTSNLIETYTMIGERLKHAFCGNEAWVISSRRECLEAIGLKPSVMYQLYNGSLGCELRKYVLFDGKTKDFLKSGKEVKTDRERREMARIHRIKNFGEDNDKKPERQSRDTDFSSKSFFQRKRELERDGEGDDIFSFSLHNPLEQRERRENQAKSKSSAHRDGKSKKQYNDRRNSGYKKSDKKKRNE